MANNTTLPDAQYRGPGGFLSTPGIENVVLSTYISPEGIDEVLPIFGTQVTNPIYPVFMGVGAESGGEPDNVCDDAPTAIMTAGHLTAAFGRVIRDTPLIDKGELTKTTRGETTSLSLLARAGSNGALYPSGVENIGAGILESAARGAMFSVGEQFKRKLGRLLWAGSVSNNDPSKPGYLEFPGIDAQVATGQVDATNNTSLADLDSYVKDAAFGALGTYDIVAHVQDLETKIYHKGLSQFSSASWVFVMRPELWDQLTAIWPIQYNTQAVVNLLNTTGVSVNVDGTQLVMARDAMRQSQQITVNGRTYPVVLDRGINMYDGTDSGVGAGEFASAIYMLPLTVNGSFPVLRLEYLDFRMGDSTPFPGFDAAADFSTDDGRYLWAAINNGWCFKFKARIEPRVVLQAPQIAGKIQRVLWAPMSMPDSPYTDEPYAQAGGLSMIDVPADYAAWK